MKNLFRVARWEFVTRIKSRSFLFNTFVSPFLFAAVITLPLFVFNMQPQISTKLIGIIDLSGLHIKEELQRELNRSYRLGNRSSEYMVMNVAVGNSPVYKRMATKYQEIRSRLDSINNVYNQIKEQRMQYYKNRHIPNRDYVLRSSYEKLQNTRDEKELTQIELVRFKTALDSVYKREAQKMADSLLYTDVLNAYLVFQPDFAKTGVVEFHTKNPGDLREVDRFEKILQTIIIKKRILDDQIPRSKIQKWFRPIRIKRYQLLPQGDQEWNFYVQFYGPLIGVFLLFMAIFTAGGYVFSSVLLEKSNRVIEVLLSYVNSSQLMGGKILGLGFLGLVQILSWILITVLMLAAGLLPADKIAYLNLQNALYFIIYFSLGFLFYGSIFVTIGSVSASEYDAQQINQLLRTIAIFPVLLSLLVLANPNAPLIRFLSYIPFLTPSFMIMRIPLSSVPITFDIYATMTLMVVSIAVMIWISGRIFRMSTLMIGKKPTPQEIWSWIKVK